MNMIKFSSKIIFHVLSSLVIPEAIETIRSQFRVTHCVLNILMTHIVLNSPGVVSLVGQLVSATMPEHVGVNREI